MSCKNEAWILFETPKTLMMPEPWNVSRGKLQAGNGTCFQQAGVVDLKSHLSILTSEETFTF